MRVTPIREKNLAFLAARRVPASLEAVTQTDGIRGSCDTATVYRTLMLFMEVEVIRQVSLPNKISYFVLNFPGESSHFLVCRCCGEIDEMPASESVAGMEREISAATGYDVLYHELVFFGLCPICQKHPRAVICAKVQPRMGTTGRLKLSISKLN